jgi:hypothetical protein
MAMRIPVTDTAPAADFEEAVAFVMDALAGVPEFRSEHGRQIELRGTLGLAVIAMAAGKRSFREIGRYGARRAETLIPLLGLSRAPSYSTVRRLLIGADKSALRDVLRQTATMLTAGRRPLVTSVDGKSMRGSRRADGRIPHVVSLFEHNLGITMDAQECQPGAAELSTGRKVVREAMKSHAQLLVETADALYADPKLATEILEHKRHYVLKLKKTS